MRSPSMEPLFGASDANRDRTVRRGVVLPLDLDFIAYRERKSSVVAVLELVQPLSCTWCTLDERIVPVVNRKPVTGLGSLHTEKPPFPIDTFDEGIEFRFGA